MRRPIRLSALPAGVAQVLGQTTPRPRARVPGAQRQVVSRWEELFFLGMVAHGLHVGCQREYIYAPGRKFRADFAFPEQRLIVEIQGGVWSLKSGHSGGTGITKDCDRANAAALAGFRVLRFPPQQVRSGQALRVLREALTGAGA